MFKFNTCQKVFMVVKRSWFCHIFIATFVFLVLWSTSLGAQEKPDSTEFRISLRSRTFTPDPGISSSLRATILERLSQKLGTHVFAQVFKLPSISETQDLERAGLKLLSSLDGNSYTAVVSKPEVVDPKLRSDIRWLGEILVNDKLQPEVRTGRYGEWAILPNGSVRLRVTFFEDVGAREATSIIRRYAETDTLVGSNTWKIVTDTTRIRPLAGEDMVQFIEQEPRPLEPLNDVTRNQINSESAQAINMGTTPPTFNGLSGTGVQVGIMDTGIDDTHEDFAGRIIRLQAAGSNHGTHVAGTAAGSGERSDQNDSFGVNNGGTPYQWRGHAPEAEIAAFPFSWLGTTYDTAIDDFGVDVTNHSHTQTPTPDYSGNSQSVDQTIWDRNLYVSAAAGNNGIGQNNGSPLVGYFSLTGSKAKNPLTVGNYNSATDIRWNGSSMGPTFDGRLKPDLVAPGRSIKSTVFNNSYGTKTGTSMAAPAVTGTLALMLQSYFEEVTPISRPLNSTMKAVLIQTAIDLVQNPALAGEPNNADTGVPVVYHVGPDWATGYGLIDAESATELIAKPDQYIEDQINHSGDTDTYDFFVFPGTSELKSTLAWDDYPGSILSSNTSRKLVNDLDLVLIAPNGSIYMPFVLRPLTPETPVGGVYTGVDPIAPGNIVPAAPGIDRLNNVEQVLVNNPDPGPWKAVVKGYKLRKPAQKYSLVLSGPFGKPGWNYQYAAKIVCGKQNNKKDRRLVRGIYATTINIHNPNDTTVIFYKKLALSYPPGGQRPGKIYPVSVDSLRPDEALEVDCMDLERRLFPNGLPAPYLEGFVVLQSFQSLDVSAVYTAATPGGFFHSSKVQSIDVEQIRERRMKRVKKPQRKPDLIVQDLDLSSLKVECPGGGGTCVTTVTFTIANIGGSDAGAFVVRVFLDPSQSVSVDVPVGELLMGATQPITISTPPGGNCFDPDCTITIKVDISNSVIESNEANNEASGTIPG